MYYFLAFLISVLTIFLAIIWWYQTYSRFFTLIHKIPGPVGVPILGNFKDYTVPLESIFRDDRERSLKYFPIYKQWILHVSAVSLLHPRDIEIVLSGSKHSKKSQIYDLMHVWLGTGLLTSHGDKWKIRRKMLTPAFHFNILQGFVDIFNEETASLIKDLKRDLNKPFINVIPHITEFTLNSIVETSMGTSLSESKESNSYKKALLDFTQVLVYRMVRPWLYKNILFAFHPYNIAASKSVKILHKFSNDIINTRQKAVRPNGNYSSRKRLAMLDLLLKAKREGANIDDEGIREEVDTFMFEGHDTTSAAICTTLLVLANNKLIQDEIRQEIIDVLGDNDDFPTFNNLQELPFTERCIKECLRLYPPVPFIARDASEEFETTTGYTIPKRAMIHLHIFDIHRNPILYPDPLKFDPDRFLPENIQNRHPFAYIPFSAGPRNCIGQKFALLEIKAALCGILRTFILEPVDHPENIAFMTDVVLRTQDLMRVKFLLRKINK